MPSFKERFRPSRKYKKNKDATTSNTEDLTTTTLASGSTTHGANPSTTSAAIIPTATASAMTIDEHTGSAALATYHSNYSMDQCE